VLPRQYQKMSSSLGLMKAGSTISKRR